MSWLDEFDDTSVPSYDWGAETDANDSSWIEAIYADPSGALDTVKTPEQADNVVASVLSKFGETAANAVKSILFKPGTRDLNLAGLGTAGAAIYGLLGGNQVQTGGYNKPIPQLTATRAQVPYAADPNRRPGEAGRQYFTDVQYTAPAGATAAQTAATSQAQGIAALATPRAKAVNPYEGKYKPAWNPPEQTEKTTTATANPASGVAQLLPVPQAQGFTRTPPERTAQNQGGATSAAPAANSGVASLPSSNFVYSSNPQEAVAQKSMQDMQISQSSKATSNPSDTGGAGYVENPAYLAADPNRMTMDYIPRYTQENRPVDLPSVLSTISSNNTPPANSKYTGLDSSQALLASQSQAGKDYLGSQAQGAQNYLASLNQTSNSPTTQSNPTPVPLGGPVSGGIGGQLGSNSIGTGQKFNPTPVPLGGPVSGGIGGQLGSNSIGTGQKFAAGGLAAGGFVVPADVVAHLGNGSSSSGLALLAEKLNAKPIKGDGDGMSDSIPTHIDGKEKALVANDEAYISPEMVAKIGGGDGKAGSEKLYAMMEKIRKARTGNPEQGKQINAEKFVPGGIAQLAGGGEIQRFNVGGTANTGTTNTVTTSNPLGTSTSSSLSPWAGDYVTGYLGRGQALANAPYQAYQGPLTAGASDLQQQAFAGIGSLAGAGYTPQTYQGGTFGAEQAQQYMNPYLSAALTPQLAEMRRQSEIGRVADAGRMTQAGAFGGSRQAIMESEGSRNLLEKQTQAIGTGYQTAYDKAMGQFNTEQDRRLGAEKASEASRQYSADFGLKSLGEMARLGETQRGIDAEGIAADKQQFEEQRDYPLKMVQYQKDLLQGLPITSAATTANTTGVSQIASQLSGLQGLYELLAGLGQAPATTTPPATSTTVR